MEVIDGSTKHGRCSIKQDSISSSNLGILFQSKDGQLTSDQFTRLMEIAGEHTFCIGLSKKCDFCGEKMDLQTKGIQCIFCEFHYDICQSCQPNFPEQVCQEKSCQEKGKLPN